MGERERNRARLTVYDWVFALQAYSHHQWGMKHTRRQWCGTSVTFFWKEGIMVGSA